MQMSMAICLVSIVLKNNLQKKKLLQYEKQLRQKIQKQEMLYNENVEQNLMILSDSKLQGEKQSQIKPGDCQNSQLHIKREKKGENLNDLHKSNKNRKKKSRNIQRLVGQEKQEKTKLNNKKQDKKGEKQVYSILSIKQQQEKQQNKKYQQKKNSYQQDESQVNKDGQNKDGQNKDGQNNDGQNKDGQNKDGQNNYQKTKFIQKNKIKKSSNLIYKHDRKQFNLVVGQNVQSQCNQMIRVPVNFGFIQNSYRNYNSFYQQNPKSFHELIEFGRLGYEIVLRKLKAQEK